MSSTSVKTGSVDESEVAKTVLGDDDDDDDDDNKSLDSLDSDGPKENSILHRASSFMQMEKIRGRVPSVRELNSSPRSARSSDPLPNRLGKSFDSPSPFGRTAPGFATKDHKDMAEGTAEEEYEADDHDFEDDSPRNRRRRATARVDDALRSLHSGTTRSINTIATTHLETPRSTTNDAKRTWIFKGLQLNEAQLKILGVKDQLDLVHQFKKILKEKEKLPLQDRRTMMATGPGLGTPTVEGLVDTVLLGGGKPFSTKEEEVYRKAIISMARVHELAVPRKTTTTKKSFLTMDDAKNCTFEPKTTTKKAEAVMRECGYEFAGTQKDEEDTSKKKESMAFVDRVTRKEKDRLKKLQKKRGETDYEAMIHKKVCPKCRISQSYDEYLEKRKLCKECGVAYRKPRPRGSKGLDAWLDDQETRECWRRIHLRSLQEKYDEDAQKAEKIRHIMRPGEKKSEALEDLPFLDRLEADLEARKLKLRLLFERKDDEKALEINKSKHRAQPQKPIPKKSPKKSPKKTQKNELSNWDDDLESWIHCAAKTRCDDVAKRDAINKSATERRTRKKQAPDQTTTTTKKKTHHKKNREHQPPGTSDSVDFADFANLLV